MHKSYLNIIFFFSLFAVIGSLFFSNVLGLPPCEFCWYQRIAMYPIPLISGIALLSKDSRAWKYILPLSVMGMLLAAYHYSIQMFDFARQFTGCSPTNPCTDKQWIVAGFITIPLLAFFGFLAINLVLFWYLSQEKKWFKK